MYDQLAVIGMDKCNYPPNAGFFPEPWAYGDNIAIYDERGHTFPSYGETKISPPIKYSPHQGNQFIAWQVFGACGFIHIRFLL